MAPGAPNARIFFKFPTFGETTLDVIETVATINGLAAPSVETTEVNHVIPVTRASDGITSAHWVAADNIAGLIDLTLVHDQP